MKNLVISTSVLLLLASFSLNTAFAKNKATLELHQAVVSGDVEKVKSLISEGADVNFKSRISWTPLHAAVRNRRKAIVELLIDNAKRGKRCPGVDQFAMNLVTDDQHIMLLADFAEAAQLITAPYPSHRVMGTAKNDHPGLWISSFCGQIVQVH